MTCEPSVIRLPGNSAEPPARKTGCLAEVCRRRAQSQGEDSPHGIAVTAGTVTSLGCGTVSASFFIVEPDPKGYTDPDGKDISPIGSPDFENDVSSALAHLSKSLSGGSLITFLNDPNIMISIYESKEGITNFGKFPIRGRYAINWDPRSGILVSSSKKVMSAAIMLLHEFTHVFLEENGAVDFFVMTMGASDAEKTIDKLATENETKIANELQEYGGRQFYDDWDSMVRTSDPLSTKSQGVLYNRLPDE